MATADETHEVEPAEPAPGEAVPEPVAADPSVELPLAELRALIEQSARESAERVHASYQRDPRIQRGLRLLEKYEQVREELANRQVVEDARRDHEEQIRAREEERRRTTLEAIERRRRIRLGGKP